MKKIYLIRSNKSPFGGAENYLYRLSNQLEKSKINHQIIHSKFPKFLPSWLRVIFFNLQLFILKGTKFYFSLERISNPDIYRAGDGVHRVFLSINKKSILNPLHPIYLYLEKKSFKNAKKIIVNSKMIKYEIQSSYGINEEKIKVIYNGFNPVKLDYDNSFDKISKEFDVKKDEHIFLFVGSGYKRKGVENFLQIVSNLKERKVKSFIIGKESNIDYYRKIASKLKIGNKVFFTGPRYDVNDFYNISHFFILPSHYEPFGNSVLEAMSYGNVVFTSKQTGASELINPEFVMEDPNDQTIVKKILDLLDDKAHLEKIKTENIIKSEKFTVEKNLAETLKVINEVIN